MSGFDKGVGVYREVAADHMRMPNPLQVTWRIVRRSFRRSPTTRTRTSIGTSGYVPSRASFSTRSCIDASCPHPVAGPGFIERRGFKHRVAKPVSRVQLDRSSSTHSVPLCGRIARRASSRLSRGQRWVREAECGVAAGVHGGRDRGEHGPHQHHGGPLEERAAGAGVHAEQSAYPPPRVAVLFLQPRRTGSLCTHPAVHVEQEATPPSHGCTVLAALGPSHQTAVSAQTADLLTSLAG